LKLINFSLMKNIISLLILSFFTISSLSLHARITLPEIVGDNMVLQQNSEVKLWGEATPNHVVTVKTSWTEETFKTTSDSNGDWIINISTPKASFKPQKITIADEEELTLENILVGEVWLASGQSNMEMPLNGFRNNPIYDNNHIIALSGQDKGIRFVTIHKTADEQPQKYVKGDWKVCNPENSPWFSATAYHFAKTLTQALDVPVGIIVSSWGGSRVEAWINRETLESYKDFDLNKELQIEKDWKRPLVMYNAMINPITNYTIKGFIWYQGEANVGEHKVYHNRLKDMVNIWRTDWGLGDLPFYYVEIAPYIYGDGEQGISAALLRESQFKAQSIIPNSGMISTNDLVEEYEKANIHPKNKTDVGRRLAYMALNETYGYGNIAAKGPEYREMEIKDNKIIIYLDNVSDGFNVTSNIEGFEIAGEDRKFLPADAKVDGNNLCIELSNENIDKPIAARYCFKNFQVGNLKNTRGLPLVPFRTDNFE
jgi:sialate O-acetylesterase